MLTVGSTMRILLLYQGEYLQWVERFMNYLEEQTDSEAMINCIKNGDQPLPHVIQVSIARNSSTEQPPLKDKSMCNKTAKDLWDALARHMLGSEYGEQDRKAVVLYEYETFKATEGELVETQNQGVANDAMGLKKKIVVVTSYPLALIAEKIKDDKKVKKKDDEKNQDMSKVKCYNYKKEGHFAKDCKKAKVKDYEYYKTKMLLAKKDKDEQVLLAEDQAWIESSSDSDQEKNVNMVLMAQIEKVLLDSEASSSSADDKISKVSYYLSKSKSEYEYETLEYYDNTTTYGLFVNDNDDQEIFHDCEIFPENLIESQIDHNESAVDHNDSKGIDKKHIVDQEVLYDKMSVQLVELDKHVRDFKISELEECVRNKDLEIEKCLEHKMYNGRKGIGFENPSYFCKAKDLRPTLYDERVINLRYTPMFLTHSDEALEIEKFKRARENKINFAYDYGNLNSSYVNEKINFSDDYFQELINPDFEKIDSLFQQMSSLKPYVLTMILKKIIIDLEDEVVRLLEKEKANLEIIKSLKSNGFESSEKVVSETENKSENDCQVIEKVCDSEKNPNVIASGIFKLSMSQSVSPNSVTKTSCASNSVENLDTLSSVRRPKPSGVIASDYINARMNASVDVNDLFVFDDIVQICLWIIDSGCLKHMTGNRALLTNFVEKFLGTVRFGNNDFAVIAGYGDVVIGSMTIKKVYYVEGLPKMKFEKDHLCSTCEQGKIHQKHHKSKTAFASNKPLYLLHMDLCGPMHVESINRKRYVLVVIDDYSRYTWAEAIATACFTQIHSIIHKHFDKTPYEFINKRKPNIKFFCVFGCRCYLLNDYEDVGKLKEKGDIGVFIGYSKESATFRIYNKRTRKIHESVNVNFDEISEMASKQFSLEPDLSNLNETRKSSNPSVLQVSETSKEDLEDLCHNFYDEYFDSSKIMKSLTTNVETSNVEIHSHEEEVFHESSESFQEESSSSLLKHDVQQSLDEVEDAYFDASTSFHDPSNVYIFYQPYPHEKKWTRDYPLYKIIGDPKSNVRTRGQLENSCLFSCLLSSIEPTNVTEALRDADWVSPMQDELDQFTRLKVWRLVPRPEDKTIIKTKWIFKNKKDESIARIKAIRLFLAYVAHKDFIVFQMDVKKAFLNRILKEEVYVGQAPCFVSKQYPNHVYALDKTLYVPTLMVEQAKLKLDLVGKPVDHTDYQSMIRSLMYVTSSRPDIMFATNQEKDKIRSKPDKNKKRGEDGKSQKQLQSKKKEKLKKMQAEGPEMQIPTSFIRRMKKTRADL
uniref:Uncharacterized protein n=1 Tax=Tanacetum cinerariifolium TaxID=118510 RepID=A0A699HH95_TANCI|nr:hypothetical protein [Tanacetum cinerariifolium]